MKYTVGVLVQGYAYANIEADSKEEAYKKAMELNHNDFAINYVAIDYDSSPKYREIWDEDGNEIKGGSD
jgi:hypothetical protein